MAKTYCVESVKNFDRLEVYLLAREEDARLAPLVVIIVNASELACLFASARLQWVIKLEDVFIDLDSSLCC